MMSPFKFTLLATLDVSKHRFIQNNPGAYSRKEMQGIKRYVQYKPLLSIICNYQLFNHYDQFD